MINPEYADGRSTSPPRAGPNPWLGKTGTPTGSQGEERRFVTTARSHSGSALGVGSRRSHLMGWMSDLHETVCRRMARWVVVSPKLVY